MSWREGEASGGRFAPGKLYSRPVDIDRADLVVDEAAREGTVAHVVLVEAGLVVGLVVVGLGADDPCGGFGWELSFQQIECLIQLCESADEDDCEHGVACDGLAKVDASREFAE